MKRFILLLVYLIPFTGQSQEVKINRIEFLDGDLVLFYDLLDDRTDRRYTIRLYVSTDNFVQPQQMVEGDIGVDVAVGGKKKVIWHIRDELGETYKGDLVVELKGQQYIPFITLDRFEDYGVIKRGRPYEVTWTGGREENVMNFELYREDVKVHVFPNIANVGQYTMTVPESVKPGNTYRLRISDTQNRDEVIHTGNFVIRRKYPVGLKILGGTAVAAGLYLLIDALLPDPVNTIPNPPDPPGTQ